MKRFGALLMTTLLLTAGLLLPSCANRVRTAELEIAPSDIEEHFAKLGGYLTANDTTGVATQFYNSATQIKNEYGSTVYYSEAPGALGPMKTAMPLNWAELFAPGARVFMPSRAYAFFVINQRADGFYGSLIITNVDHEGNPPPNEEVILFTASNDGQMVVPGTNMLLYPGEIQEDEFAMELNQSNRSQLIVRSYDVTDGDLAEVIQLDLYRVEGGVEYFVGKLNLIPQL